MSHFNDILSHSFVSFSIMEEVVIKAGINDGFVIIKQNTDYLSGKIIQKGNFKCSKSGSSRSKGARSVGKSGFACSKSVSVETHRRCVYYFTSKPCLEHNHPINPASVTKSAMARRFAPSQLELIDSLNCKKVPISLIDFKIPAQVIRA